MFRCDIDEYAPFFRFQIVFIHHERRFRQDTSLPCTNSHRFDKLNQAWFGDFLQHEQDGVMTPKYPRRGILIADEGGMGKTLSSAIIALDELYKSPDKSVVVVCPKMMKKEWESIFKWTPFPVSRNPWKPAD